MTLAWHIGAFVGTSKIPPLAEVLAKLDGPAVRKPMTETEVMHTMALWGARSRGVIERQTSTTS